MKKSMKKNVDKCFWSNYIGASTLDVMEKTLIPLNHNNNSISFDWKQSKDLSQHQESYVGYKRDGYYKKGISVVTGRINHGNWYKGKHLVCIDVGNRKGLEEVLSIFREWTLESLAKRTIVEQYVEDKTCKYHVFIITEIPIKKRIDLSVMPGKDKDDVPSIGVKSDRTTLVVVTPSIDNYGNYHQIIGTTKPMTLKRDQSEALEIKLNRIFEKYSINHKKSL